jgi:hypothetical protein
MGTGWTEELIALIVHLAQGFPRGNSHCCVCSVAHRPRRAYPGECRHLAGTFPVRRMNRFPVRRLRGKTRRRVHEPDCRDGCGRTRHGTDRQPDSKRHAKEFGVHDASILTTLLVALPRQKTAVRADVMSASVQYKRRSESCESWFAAVKMCWTVRMVTRW